MKLRQINFTPSYKQIAGLCTVFLCLILGILLYKYYIYTYFPSEPIPTGEFPNEAVWVFSADEEITATPTIYGFEVFIRTKNSICALDLSTGSVIWQKKSVGISPLSIAPQVSDDIIVVPETGSKLAAFSIKTGDLLWRTTELEINLKNPDIGAIESFEILNKVIYVDRSELGLTAYRIIDGEILWHKEVLGRLIHYISVDDKSVYLNSGYLLRAYNNENGKLLWEKRFNNLLGPLLVDEDYLYVSLLTGNDALISINLRTLGEVWRLGSNSLNYYGIRNLMIQDKILYIATDRLSAISKTDAQVHWISDKTGLLEPPIIAGGKIFVRNIDTTLFYLNAINGEELGSLLVQMNTAMKHQPSRSPVMASGLLVIPFGDNRVFAYRP